MTEVVIVNGVRTGMGSFGGALKDLTAQDLQVIVFKELFKRVPEVTLDMIDHVIVGCIAQGSDAPNIARVSAYRAGVPEEVPAYTVNQNCVSSMLAVVDAYRMIKLGDAEIVLIGGVESMSNIPYVLRKARFGYRLRHGKLIDGLWEGLTCPLANQLMGRTAENLAEEFNISREEQDKFAIQSHRKAFRALREGKLKDEIMTVMVPKKMAGRKVAPEPFATDENVNIGLNMQILSLYPPVFKENGTVTPGNACPISDAAGALYVMSERKAKELGLEPLAYIRGYGFAGVDPKKMGLGPTVATPIALKRAGLDIKDIELIELNEAFAAQVLACFKVYPFNPEITNVEGGAIALGHPVGFTGIRLIMTLGYKLKRYNKTLGLATACVGGGQGGAIVLENK